MFETEIQGPSLPGFFVQQAGACIGLVMWGLITVEVPRSFSTLNRPVAAVLETLCIIVLAATPSFFWGRAVQSNAPTLALSGKWIWLLPTIATVFISVMSGSLLRNIERPIFSHTRWRGMVGGVSGHLSDCWLHRILFGNSFDESKNKALAFDPYP
jgi:hypothetical protein